MIRDLKILALVLTAMSMAAAATAAIASAQQAVLTSDGPVALEGVEVGELNENSLTAFGGQTRCPGSRTTARKYNVTPTERAPIFTTTLTYVRHPTQSNCVSISGGSSFSSTEETNGCDTVGHITWWSSDPYPIHFDVVCPPGQHKLIKQYSGEAHGFQVCQLTIGPQTGLAGGQIYNIGGGDIAVKGTLTGVKASRSGLCGASTTENAEIHVNLVFSGVNELGEPTAVAVSD